VPDPDGTTPDPRPSAAPAELRANRASSATAVGLRRDLLVGVAATAAVSALWIPLVALRPGTTFHFAPLFAAGVAPASARVAARGRLAGREAAIVSIVGMAIVLAVTAALAATGHLSGPTLWAPLSAPAETIVFAALGGLRGWRAASRGGGGMLFGHEHIS
jgi:hypothetical protein